MNTSKSPSPAQVPRAEDGVHLVLFDGVCGLCSRLVPFLLEHDHHRVFSFAALQSAAGRKVVERFGGDPDALTSFYVLANYRTGHAQMFSRSGAVTVRRGPAGLAVADCSSWPHPAGHDPGLALRCCRQKPLPDVWPRRTVPDAAPRVPGALHRVTRVQCRLGGSGQKAGANPCARSRRCSASAAGAGKIPRLTSCGRNS